MFLIRLRVYLNQISIKTCHLVIPTYDLEELNTRVLLTKIKVRAVVAVFFLHLESLSLVVCNFDRLKCVDAAV